MQKTAKIFFFLKLTFWQKRKEVFPDLFSAFESEGNIQVEYIEDEMFLKVLEKGAKVGKNGQVFSKRRKLWFFKFWLLIFI